MANLTDAAQFDPVYQLETTDPVLAGPGGVSNRQPQELANRTAWLKAQVESLGEGKQDTDETLTAFAALVFEANEMLYATGPDAFALTDLTPFARTLLDDADAATALATLGAASINSPTFTGSPAGTTATQFNSSTLLATTGFVQRALGNFSGVSSYSVNTTLTAAHVGKIIRATAAITFTLPAASSVVDGAAISFVNGNAGTSYTIQRAGSDVIQTGADLTSVVVGCGDSIVLVRTSSGSWAVQGGSAQTKYSGQFGASLATNGYQKLPSGLIIQWGRSNNGGISGEKTGTYPIAFPNAALSITSGCADIQSDGASYVGLVDLNNNSTFNYNIPGHYIGGSYSAYPVNNASLSWIAIGY